MKSKHLRLAAAASLFGLLFKVDMSVPAQEVYFGNLHSHTSYSDGSGKPEDAYRFARDTAKVDFLAITEHNHRGAEDSLKTGDARRDGILIAKDHSLYNGSQSASLISAAKRNNKDGTFVALYGQEFSTIDSGGNHANVFEIGEVIDQDVVTNGGFGLLVQWLETHLDSEGFPAIVQFNHPSSTIRKRGIEYGADDFPNPTEWRKQMSKHVCLIEILNGPGTVNKPDLTPETYESDFLHYLNLGFKVAPTGDQDNHFKNWGNSTTARTGIIAAEKTKHALLTALRQRHVYATEDPNLKVIFRVEGHLCGDVINSLPAVGADLKISYSVVDGDEPDASYRIEAYSDVVGGGEATVVHSVNVTGNNPPAQFRTLDGVPFLGANQYVFFKVIQHDEDGHSDNAWTAPVWFEKTGAEPDELVVPNILPAGVDASKLIAAKSSGIYHLSTECRIAALINEENRVTGAAAKAGRLLHAKCPLKVHQ